MKVLVVDDSRAMRMIVGRELRHVEGVTGVAEADSAEAAIEVLGAEPVDLVLCDWNMGGMTGLELLQALRAAGWEVPFGFVTSESSEAVVADAMACGAAFLIAKPFSGEDLAAKVGAALVGGTTGASPQTAGTSERASAGGSDRATGLHHLLEGLLRRPVRVLAADAGPARQAARWTAGYLDDDGRRAALCVVDSRLASALSAALTMMPPTLAGEWADSGALPDVLSESFHEVANVIAKVVHAGDRRCVLHDISGFPPGEQLPEIEEIRGATADDSFEVGVEGYGSGLLSLVTF